MTLQEYTRATLRTELLQEFGLDTNNSALQTKANSILDRSIQFITNRRPDWPWRLADLAIDIGEGTSTTGDVTQDSDQVANLASGASNLDILTVEASATRPLEGYVINGAVGAGSTATLTSNYRGATAVGTDITLSRGFMALPTDFARLKVARMLQDGNEPRFQYLTPLAMKELKFKARQVDLHHQFYTVIPDPLAPDHATTSIQYYIELFPYVTDRSLIAGSYWRDIPTLDADNEVPIIPREDRVTLLACAEWFMARYLKTDAERLTSYRLSFFGMMASMAEFYNLSQDPGEVTDKIGETVPSWIQGPPGYPEFGQSNLV